MLAAAIRACARRLFAALDPLADWLYGPEWPRELPAPTSTLVDLCASCGAPGPAPLRVAIECNCGLHAWAGGLCAECVDARVTLDELRLGPSACGVARCEGGEA